MGNEIRRQRRERERTARRERREARRQRARRKIPGQLRWCAAFLLSVGASVLVLQRWLAPLIADEFRLVGCGRTNYMDDQSIDIETLPQTVWPTGCFWLDDWGWAAMAFTVFVLLVVSVVLANLAREWSGGRPPSWAVDLTGFTVGLVTFAFLTTLVFVAARQITAQFDLGDARTREGWLLGAPVVACVVAAIPLMSVGARMSSRTTQFLKETFEWRSQQDTSSVTGNIAVAGGTAVAAAAGTILGTFAAVALISAVVMVLLIYAAVVAFGIAIAVMAGIALASVASD